MKNLMIGIYSATLLSLTACTPKTGENLAASPSILNQRVTSFEGETMMLGPVNRSGFQAAPFKGWFEPEYTAYKPRESALQGVQSALKDVRIVVFMGTWCSDSQLEVPQFYRILDYLKFPEKKLQVYAVDNHPDRNKTTPGGETAANKIEYVPTFIFFRDGKEIGRITEYPQKSLEADMAAIVK